MRIKKIKKWIKTWGTLSIAGIALILSGVAIYLDCVHYETLTKPHSQHDEIYDRLSRLDAKIERIEKEISVAEDSGYLVGEAVEKVTQAKLLRNQAESAWDSERYSEADKFINEAHTILDQIIIHPPTTVVNWWLIGGVIAVVVVLAVVVSITISRKRESSPLF